MKQCTIKQIPIEILIMILEMMRFEDALKICCVLGIVEEMAFRYHSFYPRRYNPLSTGKQCNYVNKIYDIEKRKIVNPNLAKAMLKNVKFQSLAGANDKVMFAILSQDFELIKNALKDPRVNHDDKWCNPLLMACEFEQVDVVKLLVYDHGISNSAQRNAALCNACIHGHIEIVKYVLTNPDYHPENGSEAIIRALRRGRDIVVRFLLSDSTVDPSDHNNIAIIYAAKLGNLENFRLLLEDPRTDPADQHNQAIINAAERGHNEIFKLLLEDPRINPADQHNQSIICAAQGEENLEIVKFLLADPRVDPSDQNNQAIINAAKVGNLEIFKLLLEDARTNPADQNNQAIINAAERGHNEIFKLLLADPRVDPSDQNNRALPIAARSENMEVVKLIMADERMDKSIRDDPIILETFEKSEMRPFVRRLKDICNIRD